MNRSEADLEYRGDSSWNSGMENRYSGVRVFDSNEELLTGLAEKLTKAPYLRTLEWSKWHLLWADENLVAKKHPDSNYRQAKEAFISKVPIPPAHVISVAHGVPGEQAAEDYEFRIRQLVRDRTVAASLSTDCPRFDLILLLLGTDGHVASLFPHHSALEVKSQWVAPVYDAPRESVTITLPVINSAANVAIVATGTGVAPALMSALGVTLPRGSHPAQLVSPTDGNLAWFSDAYAASLLSSDFRGI
ncbi:PREDICTED: probable 6-phosphogluconolactonase 1 isoform X2 [Nelumbo nucifera]|uniref:Probable 6-phosphogluconolactonase n=1 Tax=Nelumbo nucifera TaxID=4432 RepID=A0A1U8B0G1_NELNU|nr:PREDICTED: probable 6-phosphogluconolactonase 1 isoform X2 [Nelumbo nucifera]